MGPRNLQPGEGGGFPKPHFHGPYFLDLRLVSYSRRSTFVSEGCWGELMGKWCRMKPKPQCKLLRSKFVLLSVGRITQSWSFFGLGTPSVVKPTLMTTIAQAHFEFCHVTKTLCMPDLEPIRPCASHLALLGELRLLTLKRVLWHFEVGVPFGGNLRHEEDGLPYFVCGSWICEPSNLPDACPFLWIPGFMTPGWPHYICYFNSTKKRVVNQRHVYKNTEYLAPSQVGTTGNSQRNSKKTRVPTYPSVSQQRQGAKGEGGNAGGVATGQRGQRKKPGGGRAAG